MKLTDQFPGYMLKRDNMVKVVYNTFIISVVLVVFANPYLANKWLTLGSNTPFIISLFFYFLAFLLFCMSRFVMCLSSKKMKMTNLGYSLWSLVEILAVSLLYSVFVLLGAGNGYCDIGDKNYLQILSVAFPFFCVHMGVPILFCTVTRALSIESGVVRFSSPAEVVGDLEVSPWNGKRITLFDNNGVLKFSTTSENLYFIEADDNYVKVWYTDHTNMPKQYMLRCSLKNIEGVFAGTDLVRCHRKYIINITKANISKIDKEGYKVDIGLEGVDLIPISKTYESSVLSRFNSR